MLAQRVQLCPTCAVVRHESSQAVKVWLALEHSIAEARRKQAAYMGAIQAIDRYAEQRNRCKECYGIVV